MDGIFFHASLNDIILILIIFVHIFSRMAFKTMPFPSPLMPTLNAPINETVLFVEKVIFEKQLEKRKS